MGLQLLAGMDRGTLYRDVAEKVRAMIVDRTYRPGDRLPSVRELHKKLGVSISTVLDAYRLLEDEGLIHPRPQSGYYVKAKAFDPLEEPCRTSPVPLPCCFAREDLLMAIIQKVNDSSMVQMASATPDPELLPLAKLNRLVSQVSRSNPAEAYAYCDPLGFGPLREQIAQRMLAAGVMVSHRDIVITSGCQEALQLSLRAAVHPGGTVAVESPTYYGVLTAIKMAGLQAFEVPTSSDGICLDALEEAIVAGKDGPNPIEAVVATPNFQNPLGSCMSDERKQRLVDIVRRNGVVLIEDDVYGDLGYGLDRPFAAKAFDPGHHVIFCSSFSKTVSPGFRVGWVIGGPFQRQLGELKYSTNVASPTLPQMVVAEFLANGGYDQYLRRARKGYATAVAQMSDAIARFFPAGTKVSRPDGGFVLWLELPEAVDTVDLYREALTHNILITPGTLFTNQESYRNCLRLNASRYDGKIERALARVGRIAGRLVADSGAGR